MIITEPGIYDIPEDEYHADPVPGGSLSSTGAKTIYPEGGPARFDYQRRHGGKKSKAMDLGTVVHGLVLGTGQPARVLDYPNWTTTKAKDAKKQAIADGCIPMLPDGYAEAQAIARAVLDHDIAGGLFAPGEFDAEVSMFWYLDEFGIWCRGRLDAMAHIARPGRHRRPEDSRRRLRRGIRESSRPLLLPRAGSPLQDRARRPPRLRPARHRLPVRRRRNRAPHLVAVYDTEQWRELGTGCCRIAYERYRDCTESGIWPGYDPYIKNLQVPRYAATRIGSEINDWHDHHDG